MVRRITPLVILALLMLGSVSVSDTMASTWNFKIENMTTFAMSENGKYIIVGCERGPLCEKGQFYVFDQYGNTVEDGCIEGEITVVDISDNGAFFIGTRNGYYYSSSSGRIQEEKTMESMFNSVSISENAIVAGTNKEILIFDENGVKIRKEIDRPVNITAINTQSTVYAAGTTDSIFLYRESTKKWEEYPVVSDPVEVAISDDGDTIVFGLLMGLSWVEGVGLDFLPLSALSSLAMTPDGKFLVCGTRKGEIFYLDESGNQKWSSKVGNTVSDISLSSDGKVVAALCGNVVLFDSEGNKLQELKSSENVEYMHLSRVGEALSCISKEELFFFKLYKRENVCTYEYPLPSRRSIPLDDQLTEAWSYDGVYNSVVTGDVNNDGKNEIVCSFIDGMVVLTSEGDLLWKKSFFEPRIAVLDLTGDFTPETIVTSSDHMRFEVFDGKGQQLSGHDFYFRWFSAPPRGVEIFALWSGDLDGDEIIEVVCHVAAGYLLEPRGFYTFEYPSFKEEWYYPVAPLLETINFADINGDGQVEIVAGSNAPCNGRRVGNTDDCHAYVYAVTLQGKEVWTRQIGDEGFTRLSAAVADVNGDGDQEIVGSGWSFEDEWGSLFVLNSDGEYIQGAGNEFDHSVFLEGVADVNNDGFSEILTSSFPSTLVLYDHRLEEVMRQTVQLHFNHYTEVIINDIDADGEKEIVLSSEDTKILILNKDLGEEWSNTFPDIFNRLKIVIANLNKCKNHLLVLSDKLYAYTYSQNTDVPCVPWVIVREGKIAEIKNSLAEARKWLEQKDVTRAAACVSQAEEAYTSIEGEGGLEEYYGEIVDLKNSIARFRFLDKYKWPLLIFATVPAFLSVIVLRKSGRKHEVPGVPRGGARATQDLMILSLEKRTETEYQVALESVQGTLYPVRATRVIAISPEMRSEVIGRVEYTSKVINRYMDSERKRPLKRPSEELKKMGTVIYKNFIPRDFAHVLTHHYLVMEAEDVQIPWELMYSDEFFALTYALSRRMKSEKVSALHHPVKREKKALIIADPTGTMPEAVTECEYLKETLQDSFAVTYLKPQEARKVDVMYHLSQGYDIIHYAGELKKEPCLPVYKDVLTCAEIERNLEGSPIVFLNGCGSARTFSYDIEGLAEVFLQRGALAYIGSLWSIHDKRAAGIAAEFYRNCLHHPVGEALRLSREKYYSSEDITWAAFIMYGDPTLDLYE